MFKFAIKLTFVLVLIWVCPIIGVPVGIYGVVSGKLFGTKKGGG